MTIYSEEGDVVIFQQEEQWQGGSMLFAHVLRTDNDEIVVLNATRFVTEEGTFFAMEKTAFDEVSLIAEAFEQSIAKEYKKSGVVDVMMMATMILIIVPWQKIPPSILNQMNL